MHFDIFVAIDIFVEYGIGSISVAGLYTLFTIYLLFSTTNVS